MTDKDSKPRIEPYTGPAGGWGALKSSAKYLFGSHNAMQSARTLLKANQPTGFDCPGCAWGDSPQGGAIDFCENGVKAVAWETTDSIVGAEFFARYPLSELLQKDHYWLESQGRLGEPLWRPAGSDHYEPLSWEDAFAIIGNELKALHHPDQAAFYTSGRTSNEAAFLYQLMVRLYGTNNFPDCSNMCHEASGVALTEAIGIGKGTVTLEDFDHAEAIFVFGQNPGTNHPRMLATLAAAAKRGATVIAVNTLRERGLQKFAHPQNPKEMLLASCTQISRYYLTPMLGGDMALLRGMAKHLLIWDAQARQSGSKGLLDDNFIADHTLSFAAYKACIDATPWAQIYRQSGLTPQDIELAARVYANSERSILCWAMGITQHRHSVSTIQEMTNLLLLKGNIGKAGAGACPVRGHSNVQGDRTMGINETPPTELLDRLESRFGIKMPRQQGLNTVQTIQALERGDIRVFIGMGGNFAAAAPDTARTEAALRNCRLSVQISTKLNRSHLVTGEQALILPCLGRTERDWQETGAQFVSVEDSMSRVHGSAGNKVPASDHLLSEPAIVAGMAKATLGSAIIDWDWYVADYDRIREAITDTIPGFTAFNQKVRQPHGFYLGNSAARREWHTASGKAQFCANPLPETILHEEIRSPDILVLQTLRSHDQYNTTIYGQDDRYRGVYGQRDVLFMNASDIRHLGLQEGDRVDLHTVYEDSIERCVRGLRVTTYDIPSGCCAAYYPETNSLVPLESYGERSFTPTSKAIAVRLQVSSPGRETPDAGLSLA